MKKIFLLLFSFPVLCFSQTNTEVHVFDIVKTENSYNLINGKNISNNSGYDNQPFFYDDNRVIFSSTRKGNTDIALYDLRQNETTLYFMSDTENGSEYSPQRIPNSKNISAVRLDKDGLQRFYEYDYKTRESKELVADFKVAYPAWFDENTVVASTIVEDGLDLIIFDVKNNKHYPIAKNVGRSIHKIPNSKLMSFISKDEDSWKVKSIDPKTKEITHITNIGKTEDVAWLPNGTLLISNGNSIYKINPKTEKSPGLFYSFSDENINNISRMAVNADGTKIVLVAEVSPEYLAEQQLTAYNNRDIDAFLVPFADNVKVYNFPNNLRYEGKDNMRKGYAGFFENTKDLHCKILKRIVFENKVIDHELVTANGRQFKAVAIYEIENGKIAKVTFM